MLNAILKIEVDIMSDLCILVSLCKNLNNDCFEGSFVDVNGTIYEALPQGDINDFVYKIIEQKVQAILCINNKREVLKEDVKKTLLKHVIVYETATINDDILDYFLTGIFIKYHFLKMKEAFSLSKLEAFHRNHKYQMMSYHPHMLKQLGQMIANPKESSLIRLLEKYEEKLDILIKEELTTK